MAKGKTKRNYKAEYAEAKRAYDELKAKYLAAVSQSPEESDASVRSGLAARTEAAELRRANTVLASRVAELETELAGVVSGRAVVEKERDELAEQTRELEASMSASMESVASLSATMRQVAPLIEELEGLKVTHAKLLKSHGKVRRRLDKKQEQLRLLRAELEDVGGEREESSPERRRMASTLAAVVGGESSEELRDQLLALPIVVHAIDKAVMLAKMKCTIKSVETEALLLATLDEVADLKAQLHQLAQLNTELNAENVALLAQITSTERERA